MDKKIILDRVFDEEVAKKVEQIKDTYVERKMRFSQSEESEESLAKKAVIVKQLMAEGLSFNEACDHKDVFIGSEDGSFVYDRYILKSTTSSYEEWYEQRCRMAVLSDIRVGC